MAPHKQTEEQTAGALHQIQPGGPTTFAPLLIQSDPDNDTDVVVHGNSPGKDDRSAKTSGNRPARMRGEQSAAGASMPV
jgi:hypothetical protein